MNGEQAVDSARHAAVLAELDRILNSAAFRNARRSQEFLRYVVTNALDGRTELLKERSIGAGVFQRAPDYDTGDDSIVRVKASELRKRLAQYYLEAGTGRDVVIDLPPGSYSPEFRWQTEAAAPVPPLPVQRGRRMLWIRLLAAACALALVGLATLRLAGGKKTALETFWAPVYRSRRPVLLCVAHPVVFTVRSPTRDNLAQSTPPETVPASDIIRDGDNYVGFGDAFALAHISGFLNRKGKEVSIRMGNNISFAELRDHPAVLIGAFTNQWTMEMMSSLRFVFDWVEGTPVIKDQMHYSERIWRRDPARPNMDYVILSRIVDSRTGDVLITAAGLAHAGTYMAGEFLTNPEYFANAVKQAPSNWAERNVQLVLEGEVIGRTPGPPKVIDAWYW